MALLYGRESWVAAVNTRNLITTDRESRPVSVGGERQPNVPLRRYIYVRGRSPKFHGRAGLLARKGRSRTHQSWTRKALLCSLSLSLPLLSACLSHLTSLFTILVCMYLAAARKLTKKKTPRARKITLSSVCMYGESREEKERRLGAGRTCGAHA